LPASDEQPAALAARSDESLPRFASRKVSRKYSAVIESSATSSLTVSPTRC